MSGLRGELILVGIITLAATATGYVFGATIPAVLAITLAYLGWHVVQMGRLIYHHSRSTLDAAAPPGSWGDIRRMLRRTQRAEHKARKRLARFDDRFREAAAVFPDALVVMSRTRTVRWCNPMAVEMLFDAADDHVAGRRLDELIAHPRLQSYLTSGDYQRPLVLNRPQHGLRVLSLRILPFGRKKHQLLLIASDITRIYHLDVARRDFVANVSHELRTPLTVITGYLDPLSEHFEHDAEWSHSLDLMQQQAARMRQMINDLTLLSRLESEEKPRRDEAIAMAALLDEIVKESLTLDIAARHTVTVDADGELVLRGDRGEIRSAVSNLLINAIRHTPGGTKIKMTWQRRETGAIVSVADDGPGIAADHLPRLTERFYRVDPGRARSAGGTGLGLAIVKHVLNRHDAQLSIDSTPGHGSVFVCEFPADRLNMSSDTTNKLQT